MKRLFDCLELLYPLSDAVKSKLEKHIFTMAKNKHEYLLSEGEFCHHIWFLESGLVRSYFERNGHEVTVWFLEEDNFITLFESLLRRKKSLFTLEAIEPCMLCCIRFDHMRTLIHDHPELIQAAQQLKRKYSLMDTLKIRATSQLSPAERYRYFQKHFPHLLNRLKLEYIASYLDMNVRTLTRIRKNS